MTVDIDANMTMQERIITERIRARREGRIERGAAHLALLRGTLASAIRAGEPEPDWSKYPQAAKYFGR